jgi:formamidopyrimidine-DNA glycosylase
MPELPEVEIVRRNISELLLSGNSIKSWTFNRADLRFPIPKKQLSRLIGQKISQVQRRAKYLLFHVEEQVILSHLGMTGQWRAEEDQTWIAQKHDHVVLSLSSGKSLVFHDPRRFGFIEVLPAEMLTSRFSALGPEPLDKDMDPGRLTDTFLQLKSPVKTALMNQRYLVGVGNIYAAEALFRAGIHPLKKCSQIKPADYALLWREVRLILEEAIKSGGSSIENYRNTYSQSGQYQERLQVYGRTGEPCVKCHSLIINTFLAGRNTFWCPSCQKKKLDNRKKI